MPVGIGLGLTAGATAISGGLQAGAAANATSAAKSAQQQTLDWTKQVYGNASSALSPTISQGSQAGSALAGLLGIGGNPAASDAAFKNYLGSTNYKFQLDQGLNGIEYANAPAFASGATAKALNNYAQGQAGNALSGYEGLLQGQQTLGTNAALGLGGIGVGAGNTINSATQAAAGTIGSAGVYGANAGQNALTGLAGLVNQGLTQSSFGGGSSVSSASNPFAAGTSPAGLDGLI